MDLLSHPSPLNAILFALAYGPHCFEIHRTKLRRGLTILASGSMQMFPMWDVCPCHNDFSKPGWGSQRLAISNSPHLKTKPSSALVPTVTAQPTQHDIIHFGPWLHGFKTHRTKLRKGLTILTLGFGRMFPMWGVCPCPMPLSQQIFQASLGVSHLSQNFLY